MGKLDIIDIKNEVKKGNINFFIKNGNLLCNNPISQECVCVKNDIEDKSDLPPAFELSNVYMVIKVTDSGKDKYFRYICDIWQGDFYGEVVLTSSLLDATKYHIDAEKEAQGDVDAIYNVLHKNPTICNPRFIFFGSK